MPILWSDMLVSGWNGADDEMHRAVELLSPETLAGLTVMSWRRTGDSLGQLEPLGVGFVRAHTGYRDWHRTGLEQVVERIDGEGYAIFNPAPWSAFGWVLGHLDRVNDHVKQPDMIGVHCQASAEQTLQDHIHQTLK